LPSSFLSFAAAAAAARSPSDSPARSALRSTTTAEALVSARSLSANAFVSAAISAFNFDRAVLSAAFRFAPDRTKVR